MKTFSIIAVLLLALLGKVCAQTGITVIPTASNGSGVGSGAAPLAQGNFVVSNFCTQANTGNCFFVPANTQVSNACSWSGTTVTCGTQVVGVSASVNGSNSATYTSPYPIPLSWAVGNSITVINFSGSDTFFNQTCTLTAVTATTVSCALTHASASSTTTGVITNTSVGPFVAGDATGSAKIAWGYSSANGGGFGCNPYQAQPVAAYITTTHVNITGFISSTQVTISATVAVGSVNSTSCFFWGTPDDSGATALEAAYDAAPSCPQVEFLAGNYLFQSPHFATQPAACWGLSGVISPNSPNTTLGNMSFHIGINLHGRGIGATQFTMPPDFGPCTNGIGNNACWIVPGEGYLHDLSFTQGGQRGSSYTNFLQVGVGTLERVTLTGIGLSTGGTCVDMHYQAQVRQVNESACGADGFVAEADTGSAYPFITNGLQFPMAKGYWLAADNNHHSNLTIGNIARFRCTGCMFFGSQDGGGGMASVRNGGGELWLDDTSIVQVASTTPNSAYTCTNAVGILHTRNVVIQRNATAVPANGIVDSAACTEYLQDSVIVGQGAGNTGWLTSVASGKTYVDNATLQQITAGTPGISGSVPHDEKGTCTFAAGTTCAVTFSVTFGSTSPAFLITPVNPGAVTFTVTALSATGATITASGANSLGVGWAAHL